MSNTALALNLDEFSLEMRLHYLTATLESLNGFKNFENYFAEVKLTIDDWISEARSNELSHFVKLLETLKVEVAKDSLQSAKDAEWVSASLKEYLETLKSHADSEVLFEKYISVFNNHLGHGTQRYLHCVRNQHRFLVPVKSVIEIVTGKKIYALPKAQVGVLGLISFRGQGIPVINLQDFGFDSEHTHAQVKTYFVVCEYKESFFAIEVNATEEVAEIESTLFQKCSESNIISPVVDQFVIRDQKSLMLFNIEKLVKYE